MVAGFAVGSTRFMSTKVEENQEWVSARLGQELDTRETSGSMLEP